jgi:hypothetical protein
MFQEQILSVRLLAANFGAYKENIVYYVMENQAGAKLQKIRFFNPD